jgi:hypothetical protein
MNEDSCNICPEAKEEIMKAQGTDNSKTSIIALFTMVFMWAASGQVFAQNSNAFSGLQKHINKLVAVDTQDGHVTGQLLRVEESRLVVYEAGMPKPIARESVKKVVRHKSRHTAAWVAGMSAAGLGTGFLLGMRAFDDTRNANTKIATVAAVEGGVGAAVGYGLSRIGKRDEVVYRSADTK